MHLSKRQLAVLALITANIIWGASFPIYKWTLADVPPFTFVFLRFSLGAIILLPFTFHKLKIAKKDIRSVILAGIIGITFCISFLFLGLQIAPSINASIILSSTPIILILFAIFYMKEQARKKVIIGTGISLIGIMFIILQPVLENGFSLAIIGNLLFLLATIAGCIHTVILEKIMKRYHVLTIVFWTFIVGCIPLIPMVIVENGQFNLIGTLSTKGLIGVIYGFLFASAIAHFLFAYGVKYIRTSEVGIFGYVDPLATVLVAMPLLGEQITTSFLLGAIFVFGGIYIAEKRIHYHPIHLLRQMKSNQ
jgi:drug/metabolite transporter (DMT)-like permease